MCRHLIQPCEVIVMLSLYLPTRIDNMCKVLAKDRHVAGCTTCDRPHERTTKACVCSHQLTVILKTCVCISLNLCCDLQAWTPRTQLLPTSISWALTQTRSRVTCMVHPSLWILPCHPAGCAAVVIIRIVYLLTIAVWYQHIPRVRGCGDE